jgi:hypothetical protein
MRVSGISLAAISVVFVSTSPVFAQKIYFVETNRYQLARANLDGTGYEVVRPSPMHSAGTGFVLDWPNGWLYAYDADANAIIRSHLDGRHAETVVSKVPGAIKCLAIDGISDVVYWTQLEPPFLRRAPMGGEAGELLALDACDVDDVCYLKDVVVDPAAEKIYWSEYVDFGSETRGRILRANLDGTGAEPIYQSAPKTRALIWDLALVDASGQLYWLDTSLYEVARIDMKSEDATVILDRFDGVFGALGIGIDPAHRKLYYFGSAFSLHRANLDGTGLEPLVYYLPGQPGYIAIDPRQAGDIDASDTVDLADFAAFQRCFSEVATLQGSPACTFFDTEGGDDDADSADYVDWLELLTGPAP